jgi:hypothetical protein
MGLRARAELSASSTGSTYRQAGPLDLKTQGGHAMQAPHDHDSKSPGSNPTASSGVDRYQTGTGKTPVFWRPARLEKRLDFRWPTRNATPQAPCTEPTWALQTVKGTSPICEKPWENQGFAAERTGTELFDVFPMFLKQFERYLKRSTLAHVLSY